MDWIDTAFTATGLKLKTVIAGAMGAFISLRFFDDLKLWERWTTFLGGWALASWWAEGVAYFLALKLPALESGIALGLGLFGMALAAAVMKLIRETDWAGILRSILNFRIGGDK
jgi:hypothetical protein